MGIEKNKIENGNWILIGWCLVIIVIVGNKYSKLSIPSVVNDEFGYWLSAAFFAGKDWSSTAQGIFYYGYGYGMILSIILRFCNEYMIVYKIALVLNAVWLCLSFLLLLNISKRICIQMPDKLRQVVCLMITLGSSNICLANYTLPEIYLFFLFCLIVWTFIKFIETGKYIYSFFLAIEVAYTYSVHQRTIVLFVAIVISLLFYSLICKKICLKKVFVFIFLSLLVFIFFLGIKNKVMAEVWNNNSITQGNDFSGQMGKIRALFSKEGIISLLQNLCGRYLYLFVSTFGLGYIVYYHFIKKIVRSIKKKEEMEIIEVLIVVSFTLAIIVSAIFLLYPDHTTHVFYGRYTENYYGPLMLLGVCILYEQKTKLFTAKAMGIYLAITFIMTKYISYAVMERKIPIKNYAINATSFSWMYKAGEENVFYFMLFFIFYTIFAIEIVKFYKIKGIEYITIIGIIIIQIVIGNQGYHSFQERYFDNLNQSTQNVYNIVSKINQELGGNINVYVVDDNSGVFCASAPIQYVLMKDKVIYFEDINSIEGIEENGILFSAGNVSAIEGLKKIHNCGLFDVWINEDNIQLKEIIDN